MLKMLATQLTGKFNQIQETESFTIEDAARALAQAIVGDGTIYWCGFGEMESIVHEAISGAEKLPKSKPFDTNIKLTAIDRVVIAARFADQTEAIDLVKKVKQQGAQVIVLAAKRNEEASISDEADFFIDTKITESLLPLDMDRIGFPAVMTMFYAYYGIYLTTMEILSEYE